MILSNNKQEKLDEISEASFCIIIGTLTGLAVYEFFLIGHIDIFGWNLGLIFAPLIAGYVETGIAKRFMGETTGAVSAFILFAVTTIYSFILANPTLGVNVITFGSIFIILQAALPTLINYFIIITIISIISYMSGIFKKISNFLYKHSIGKLSNKKEEYITKPITDAADYNDDLDIDIDNLGFELVSIDTMEKNIEEKGIYEGRVIYKVERKANTGMEMDQIIEKRLDDLIKAKNQAIMNLTENAKENGCNIILNLNIEYGNLDNRGTICLVVASGTGAIKQS